MNATTYDQQMTAARERLRRALAPQIQPEHTWTDWLISNMTPAEADVFSNMAERRTRTAARAARMDIAQRVIDEGWAALSPADHARMEHVASGGDPSVRGVNTTNPESDDGVQPSSHTVADATARVQVADAYERGRREGIEWAAEQQAAGRDPELWERG